MTAIAKGNKQQQTTLNINPLFEINLENSSIPDKILLKPYPAIDPKINRSFHTLSNTVSSKNILKHPYTINDVTNNAKVVKRYSFLCCFVIIFTPRNSKVLC